MKPSWRSQLAEGRVFELRSASKHYPAPCALCINATGSGWSERIFVGVDRFGVIGHGSYARRHNPGIFVEGIKREQFNSSRVLRRRRDLERFDADDLALIRYGLSLDFTGRIRGTYSDMSLPAVVPAEWTVFWVAALAGRMTIAGFVLTATASLRGSWPGHWHFESHGGCRHLGYRFGRAWATRHSGVRLNQIRKLLQREWGSGLIEQQVKVVRWADGQNIFTEEIRRECPALRGRACMVQTPTGMTGIYR